MTLAQVVPITRAVSKVQCKRTYSTEEALVRQLRWSFAVWRDWNRFWWGA